MSTSRTKVIEACELLGDAFRQAKVEGDNELAHKILRSRMAVQEEIGISNDEIMNYLRTKSIES